MVCIYILPCTYILLLNLMLVSVGRGVESWAVEPRSFLNDTITSGVNECEL